MNDVVSEKDMRDFFTVTSRPWRVTAKRRRLLEWLISLPEGDIRVATTDARAALGRDWWRQLAIAQRVNVEGGSLEPGFYYFSANLLGDIGHFGAVVTLGRNKHEYARMVLRGVGTYARVDTRTAD